MPRIILIRVADTNRYRLRSTFQNDGFASCKCGMQFKCSLVKTGTQIAPMGATTQLRFLADVNLVVFKSGANA